MGRINNGPGYKIERFDRIREVVIDVMLPARKKHNIHILFEADITDVRMAPREEDENRADNWFCSGGFHHSLLFGQMGINVGGSRVACQHRESDYHYNAIQRESPVSFAEAVR